MKKLILMTAARDDIRQQMSESTPEPAETDEEDAKS